MSLRSLPLKKSYDSDDDDILSDFYIPSLSNSILYKRLAGFFSSTTLTVAAKGISKLISNGGEMKLITGVRFSQADIEAIKEAQEKPDEVIARIMLKELDSLENKFVEDHVRALAWMVANKKLEIKVALILDEDGFPIDDETLEKNGIFHQKVGIMEDTNGDSLSFSGSENESASGWLNNIEEFKVFRSWEKEESDYFNADCEKFLKFWNGYSKRAQVIEIPEAIRKQLIKIAPDHIEDLNLDKWVGERINEIELRDYQKQAVIQWLTNNRRGIFEMATGTGKTITALSCLEKTLMVEKKLVIIITSPFIHLSKQWIKEANKFNIECDKIIADSSENKWKDKLVDELLDVENGINENLMVLTTHNTFSTPDFINIIQESKKRRPSIRLFLIVDEVHGIGAPERKKGLIDEYDYRLGLSATPKRWFDWEGTDKIFDYFGSVIFEFSLKDAIDAGYLTPYIYKPYFTTLTPGEMEKYENETRKISKAYYRSKDDDEKDEIFTLLCIKRQKIIRNALNKLVVFEQILDKLEQIRYCLVYCSPQQIRIVQNILNKRNIIQHKFTEREGTKNEEKYGGLSEREFLIKKFAEGVYHALVSMRCLDEGVDVPPAQIAIMLDNSGNPREYIQRRGRVLRKFPGKNSAIIFDVIIEPVLRQGIPKELAGLERKIIAKELLRYREFASSSRNVTECMKLMENVESIYGL